MSQIDGLLDHPLFGTARGFTAIGLGVVGVLTMATILQWVLAALVFVDARALALVPVYDGYAAVLIVGLGLSTIGGIIYGWINGGPLLAMAIPLVPTLVAATLRGQVTITVDFLLLASAATFAGWLGLWQSYPPGKAPRWIGTATASVAFVTALSTAALWKTWTAGGHASSTGLSFAIPFYVAGVLTAASWLWARVIDGR